MRPFYSPPSPQDALMSPARLSVPGVTNVFYEPLYDYQTKTAAATTSQTFFADPIGSGTKTISDTNMQAPRTLPVGQRFVCQGIQVELMPDIVLSGTAVSQFANDVYLFYKTGALRFVVNNTPVLTQANLLKFAPRNRLDFVAAVSNTNTTTVSDRQYASAAGPVFQMSDLVLESGVSFSVELVNTSAISTTARVGVTLLGWMYRNVQ